MRSLKRFNIAPLIFLTCMTQAAAQESKVASDAAVLHLTEAAERNVARDRLRIDLASESADPDAAKVQAEINRRMNAALARAKSLPDIAIETNGYSVYQDRPDKGPVRWHGSQSMSLTAKDFGALLTLVGALQQDGLVVRGLAPELSREARQSVEDELTDVALVRLQKRADRIAAGLGMKVERFRNLNVGNVVVPRPPIRAMMAVGPASVSSPPPVAEPGEAVVSVSVDAEIMLAPRP